MTDREQYNQAAAQAHELGKFLAQPRCINCEHFVKECEKHGPIPEEYLFKPNDCDDHLPKIPF